MSTSSLARLHRWGLTRQQHFVPYPAGRMVTARPLPGLRRYAGSADGRLCLAHDHFRVFAYSAVRHIGNNGRDNGHRVCKDDDHGLTAILGLIRRTDLVRHLLLPEPPARTGEPASRDSDD